MAEEQQEMYRVLLRDMPQSVRQGVYLLKALQRHVAKKQAGKNQAELDLIKAKAFAEDLAGLEITPELEKEFLRKSPQERQRMLRQWSQQVAAQKLAPGEKSLEFLMKSGKGLAEPHLLEAPVNLDQLKNVLEEYGLQFHIKPLEDQTHEIFFYAKDANVARAAFSKAINEIVKDPSIVSSTSLKDEIKAAQQAEEKAIQEKMAEKMAAQREQTQTRTQNQETPEQAGGEAPVDPDLASLAAQEVVAPGVDLFDGGPDL